MQNPHTAEPAEPLSPPQQLTTAVQLRSLDLSGTAATDCLLYWLALRCCARLQRLVLTGLGTVTGGGTMALCQCSLTRHGAMQLPAVMRSLALGGQPFGLPFIPVQSLESRPCWLPSEPCFTTSHARDTCSGGSKRAVQLRRRRPLKQRCFLS